LDIDSGDFSLNWRVFNFKTLISIAFSGVEFDFSAGLSLARGE
jgi:hypothetical protein